MKNSIVKTPLCSAGTKKYSRLTLIPLPGYYLFYSKMVHEKNHTFSGILHDISGRPECVSRTTMLFSHTTAVSVCSCSFLSLPLLLCSHITCFTMVDWALKTRYLSICSLVVVYLVHLFHFCFTGLSSFLFLFHLRYMFQFVTDDLIHFCCSASALTVLSCYII